MSQTNKPNKKSLAREFLFQYFFHLQLPVFKELREEAGAKDDDKTIMASINEFKESTDTLLEKDLYRFVLDQARGALRGYGEIEERISKNLKNWKLARLSKVDHTVLILAANEMLFYKQTPPKVVINEYIEIAKKYGTKESPSFINGVLDSFSKNELESKE